MRIGSICSGIGGLELGLERAGLGHTVWQAEIDPHASEVLAKHWPGVPNLGDFRESGFPDCDVLVGGFPCQPVSTAGRRAGTDDERWLFDDIVDALGRMGTPPRLCVFENVRGLLSANGGAAMARVVHGLASVGFVGRYGLLRAADVGACHRRERVFIVAAHAQGQRTPAPFAGVGPADHRLGERPEPSRHRGPAPDPAMLRRNRPRREPDRSQNSHSRPWGPYLAAIDRWTSVLGRPAPPPTVDGRLSPDFVCWMMGFPEGWVDGLTRTAALRCLGNAVVPQVAELVGRMVDPTFVPLNMLVEQVLV